jgi:hypothetical protein
MITDTCKDISSIDPSSINWKQWRRWISLGFVSVVAIASTSCSKVMLSQQHYPVNQLVNLGSNQTHIERQVSRPISVQAIAEIEGEFRRFTRNGQSIITVFTEQAKTYLYDLMGKELARFAGDLEDTSPTGQHIVTSDHQGQTRLYDISGKQLAQFEGIFFKFNVDGQRLVSRSSSKY